MVKRTIQTSKPGFSIGIEHDQHGIRAARLAMDGRGGYAVDRLEDVKGDFAEDDALLEGFRQLKDRLNLSQRDALVACISGKQVFASQMEFRMLPHGEMEQALRLELRKIVHFEVATATLDYQLLPDVEAGAGMTQVLVALAANTLLKRETRLLEKAGLKPTAVDVLAIAVANALWTWKRGEPGNHPLVALHVGPQISTIVIDGDASPFFNRNVYFSAEDTLGKNTAPAERDKRVKELADEIARSLAFYEKSSFGTGFRELVLMGEFLEAPSLEEQLRRHAGLPVSKMNLPSKLGHARAIEAGHFDLAIALAMRGET
jgi:Tfp pilus assembly PilM family ATPase